MRAKLSRFFRMGLAVALYYSGLMSIIFFVRRRILGKNDVCVLCLHRVLTQKEQDETSSLPGMILREETFAGLVRYLSRHFEVISLETLLSGDGRLERGSTPKILLTFDDGWGDDYFRAYPWLKKFCTPAVIFIVTGFVNERKLFWVERLSKAWKSPADRDRLQKRLRHTGENKLGSEAGLEDVVDFLKHMPALERDRILASLLGSHLAGSAGFEVEQALSWQEIEEMSRQDIEFAAHTVTHPLLPYEEDCTVEQELKLAKQELEGRLQRKIRAFAYPNGAWDERVRKHVIEAGYECAFTTRTGWYRRGQDLFTIRRILVHEAKVTMREGKFSPAMFSFTLGRGIRGE